MKKGLRTEVKKMGPLKVAHLNGLSVSRPPLHNDFKDEPERASNDERVSFPTSPLLHFLTAQTNNKTLMDERSAMQSIDRSPCVNRLLRPVGASSRPEARKKKESGPTACW